MKEKLYQLEQDNTFIKRCTNIVRKLHTLNHQLCLLPGELIRGIGINQSRFLALRKLKGKYTGERCFIIATGPSLREEDLIALTNEFTFGMNSVCKLFPKMEWRPTFYGIQDLFVYDNLTEELKMTGSSIVLVGDNIAKKRNISDSWIRFPLNTAYNEYDQYVNNKYPVKFSDDCYRVVYNGYSITFSLIEIAAYLGFKEIYLIGADCSFSKTGNNHFIEHGHVDKHIETAQKRNFAMYRCAKEYCDDNNIKLFNSTRGGELEILTRIDFDSIEKK